MPWNRGGAMYFISIFEGQVLSRERTLLCRRAIIGATGWGLLIVGKWSYFIMIIENLSQK